jgi:vacuolar-type H+-ATPase subunit I/STV1
MSNLNTILNKLGKIEEIHETNLAKHEVELSIIDNVAKEVTSLTDELLTAKAKYSNAITEIRSKADKTINAYSKIQDKLIKIEKQINELGIVAPKNFDDASQQGYNMFVIAKRILQDVKDIK